MADIVGRVLGFFSPKAEAKRAAWQVRLRGIKEIEQRGYAAARRDRLTSDWQAAGQSPDAQLLPDLYTLRTRSRQMCRDNPYAAAAKRNLVAQLVGDGIEARAVHPDPKVAKLAQDSWRLWCLSKVDGRNDFYGVQKLVTGTMIEGGEALLLWKAAGKVPDARIDVLDGDFLDASLNYNIVGGGMVRGGVEFDADGTRVAYHLWDRHPGDTYALPQMTRSRVDAQYVDHVFEAKWGGQVRGEPWFHAGLRRLHDVSELEEAVRVKKRVEACLALIRIPAAEEKTDRLGEQKQENGRTLEALAPGMIATVNAGETIEVVNPSSSGDTDAFLRSELMGAAAALGIPYHMLTGDVSQANYSSLRAATVVFWALLDDWQQNTLVPLLCDPAFARVMRRTALITGEKKLLDVVAHWTPPARAWVDPLKDITAEIMEMRAIPGLMPRAYAERGLDWRSSFAEQFQVNDEMDLYGLASDADPRKVNGVGNLQPPAGFVIAQPGAAAAAASDEISSRALWLVRRSIEAEDAGDAEVAAGLLRAATAELRRAA